MYNDFKELLFALNAHRVRYLIVGGYAVSFHAEPDGFFRMGTPPVMVDILPKISAGRAQDLVDVAALRESRERAESDQLGTPPGGSGAIDEIRREQARGRENWLEMRRKRIERSSTPAPDRSHDKNEFTRDADKGFDDDIET
jgi:hypothetical protein